MLYDSTFLIHLAGHRGRAHRQAAQRFLAAHGDEPVYTSRVAWAEFAKGCANQDEVLRLLEPFAVVEINEHVAWTASRIARGLPIGDNDIWIAATALAYRLPLVSRNARHFARVPGLNIEEY